MKLQNFTPNGRRTNRGVSLIIVLVMLVVIGVSAAVAMRSSTSEQRLTNNLRVQGSAQQYAEAALRYCEEQIALPSSSRVSQLQTPTLWITTGTVSSPLWTSTVTWLGVPGTGGASNTRVTIPATQLQSVNSSAPATLPQCAAELDTYPSSGTPTFTMTVITARGFSPDYESAANGDTKRGAVVWLQSIVTQR